MSNIVIKQILQNGPKNALIYVYMKSDGTEGELTNYVLLDPSDLQMDSSTQFTVTQIWHAFSWFDAMLSFDDLVPYPSWNLTRDQDAYTDLRYFGGLKDQSGIDHTSKLLITTSGFAPDGSVGTLIVELKKN